jgi:hypothetical protein
MSDIIVTIPGSTEIITGSYPASSIVITFPASNYTVVTVIDRGILYGIQGPSGQAGGVNTINGQSGNVNLDTSEIPENPSALYFTNTRVYTKVKASLIAGSNTSITFDDALQTITIASQGNVQSVNTKTGAVVLTTTDINEGTNEYFTATRVRAVVLTGLSLVTNAVISATDSVVVAFGKLQAQITANANATLTALGLKQDTLVSGSNIKTINGESVLGSGDIVTSIQLSYRHDFNVFDYLGKAASGSSESANVWTITRLTIASNGTVTKGVATNVNWTDRYTHIYL